MSPKSRTGLIDVLDKVPYGAAWAISFVVALAVLLAIGVGLYFTSGASFLGGYHTLNRDYTTLQSSSHAGLRCNQCHVDSRGAVIAGAARVGDFYAGLFRNPKQPQFVVLPKPSSDACLKCHREDWSMDAKRTAKVPHPAHLRVATETRECVTCHKWTAHEESYMRKHTAMPFSTVCASFGCHVGFKQTDECASCHHSLQEGAGGWKTIHPQTVRASGANGCLETCHTADQCRQCHTTGVRPVFNSGGVTGVTAIERAHVRKDWLSQHGTFALAGPSKCLKCHVSEGECKDCHSKRPAFHGPPASWLGRHQPLAKKDPRRCLTCHEQKFCDACHKQFKAMQ